MSDQSDKRKDNRVNVPGQRPYDRGHGLLNHPVA